MSLGLVPRALGLCHEPRVIGSHTVYYGVLCRLLYDIIYMYCTVLYRQRSTVPYVTWYVLWQEIAYAIDHESYYEIAQVFTMRPIIWFRM